MVEDMLNYVRVWCSLNLYRFGVPEKSEEKESVHGSSITPLKRRVSSSRLVIAIQVSSSY